MKKIKHVLPILCVITLLSGCGVIKTSSSEQSTPTVSAVITSQQETTKQQETTTIKEETTPETTESIEEPEPQASNSVVFDDLEITIDPNITVTSVSNQFSDLDGSTVLAVPMTIKNVGNETNSLNMFYAKSFGSKGTELENVYFYFDDGSTIFKDIRSGASMTSNYYLLYDGDGTYYITFKNFSEEKEIAIDVKLD